MNDTPKDDRTPSRGEEERLSHALVSRGLITREEALACRGEQPHTPESLLGALVERGALTATQAERARDELSSLMAQQVPGYLFLEKLGQGAMGVVYKARQVSMNRLVAVKILNPRYASRPDFLDRLTREAHLAAKLSHNNVVQAIDVGSAGPLHYFVMEYVEGTTIRELQEKGKVFEEREAIEIVVQLAQALEHVHRRGLVHRDVKPANILLTPDGVAKLADLGMSRESDDEHGARRERGMAIGTPFYIAPEQVRGRDDVDGRADLYSLGATLYHMITGRPPFPYKDIEKVFRAHLSEKLTPPEKIRPELSSGIGEVIAYLMAKDRDRRYPAAADVVIDLECLLNYEPPRIARAHFEAASLADLAEVENADDEPTPDKVPAGWFYGAIIALGVSLLINLILFMRSRG